MEVALIFNIENKSILLLKVHIITSLLKNNKKLLNIRILSIVFAENKGRFFSKIFANPGSIEILK